MKAVTFLFFTLMFTVSCKKNSNDSQIVNNPPVVVPSSPDTLSAGWSKLGAIPVEETVTDIFFIDQNNGYITTDSGIYRSSNGGVDWVKANNITGSFYNISAVGPRATFVGESSNLAYTVDNGLNIQNIDYSNAVATGTPGFQDCSYGSSNTCYVASHRYIWKSTNGGISFDSLYNFGNDYPRPATVQFINDLEGWVKRDSTLYKTIDGGVSWNSIKTFNNSFYSPLSFQDRNNGFVANNAGVFKTNDGGATWQAINRFTDNGDVIMDIHFFNSLKGYCVAGTKIYKTINGGDSWTKEVTLGGKELAEIFFLDETHGWACGEYGYVLRFVL